MLRKLSITIAGTMLLSGVAAAAQPTSPFPMSVNETGVYQPEPWAPSAMPSTAAAPVAESSTFPMSVSETGANYPDPASRTLLAAGPGPSHAEMLERNKLGERSQPAAVDKTVRVGASTQYVNVSHDEAVRFIDDKGQSFTWQFGTLWGDTEIPLKTIAPAEFHAGNTAVYVSHPLSHRSSD